MRSLYITRYGGPEVLEVREAADPVPAEGQVLIDVARAGLNFSDVVARVGLYLDAPKPPMVVGYEVAGTVLSLGAGVEGLTVGQRVLACCPFGGHTDRLVTQAALVLPLPEAMSFDQGAALPVQYLTAYHMLFHVGRVRPKDRVLIHAAAGGVGQAAVQLCRTVPEVELFGTASPAKHEALRQSGVHHPIDYRSQDYAEEVRRLTDGRGVHLVLDPLGGKSWRKGFSLLAPAGHLIAFGWSNLIGGEKRNILRVGAQLLQLPRFSPVELMQQNRSVSGVNLGHLWGELALLRRHLEALLALFQAGSISPQVDQVFPLSRGADAHRYLQGRRNVGKVLLDCKA